MVSLIFSRGLVPAGYRQPDSSGVISLPSSLSHLFVKALVADGLVPQSHSPTILSLLADLEEVTLEGAASALPDPWWGVMEYLHQFFYSDKGYAYVPGLPNLSLISLLSSVLTNPGRYAFPYTPRIDHRLLLEVEKTIGNVEESEIGLVGFNFPSLPFDKVYLGHDVPLSLLPTASWLTLGVKEKMRPGRGARLESRVVVFEAKWVKMKPCVAVARKSKVNLLSIFGDEAEAVFNLLDEIAKEGGMSYKMACEYLKDYGDELMIYDLARYGFVRLQQNTLVLTPKGAEAIRRYVKASREEGQA